MQVHACNVSICALVWKHASVMCMCISEALSLIDQTKTKSMLRIVLWGNP